MNKLFRSVNLFCFFCLMNLSINAQVTEPKSSQEQPTMEYLCQSLVVNYDLPESADLEEREKRKLKNKRYDNRGWVSRNPNPESVGRSCDDCVSDPPAMPTLESDFIIIGEIISGTAFLSTDKSGIYTEYAVRIEEVIKGGGSNKAELKDSVMVDRAGGCVKYPNGQKMFYIMSGPSLPRVGNRYVLFLNNTDKSPNYNILVGYRLLNGRVVPIDDGPSQNFKEMSQIELIKKIREAITSSSKNSATN